MVSQLTHIFLILADENLCALVHSMLKNEYFQRGGHDPEILAQIRDLEYEAQRMQATQRPQGIKDNEYFSLNIALVIDKHICYTFVSSVDRALHQYHRGHGFKSRTGMNFFQALFSPLLK